MVINHAIQENELHKEDKLLILAVLPIVFFIYGIIVSFRTYNHIEDFANGFKAIILSPTILVTDFMQVGGLGAAFIQASLIGFTILAIFKGYKLRINGLLIAAYFTVIGFAFFGKNIVNIPPIFLGGFLYSRYQKIPFKNIVLVIMFSTALSPLVSELTFMGIFPKGYNLIAGVFIGAMIGFVIVPLSSHMLRFHDGFNLYNIGFTAGIVGTVMTSFLRNMEVEVQPVNIIYMVNEWVIWLMLLGVFAFYCVVGILIKPDGLKAYTNILSHRGRTITDFTALEGYGVTFLNMGIMGCFSLFFVFLLGGILNGPVLAGVLTVVGFAAFGKHPKNCLPLMIGVILAGIIFKTDLSATTFIIAVLFSTTIAPIAGGFGFIAGLFAGVLHYVLVTNVGVIHGGMNLYNNGFSGGLVAGFLVPILDAFRKKDEKRR